MAAGGVCGGWGKAGWVGGGGLHGGGEGVVDLQDHALGAVVAVETLLVLATHNRERVHDVRHGVSGRREGRRQGPRLPSPLLFRPQIQMEERSVQLAP